MRILAVAIVCVFPTVYIYRTPGPYHRAQGWATIILTVLVVTSTTNCTVRAASGFTNGTVIAEGVQGVTAVFAADIDDDGDLDVLSASDMDARIAWYENLDGLGTFGAQSRISSTTAGASSVYAADLDGDGDLDILATGYTDDSVVWFENIDGVGGEFSTPINISFSVNAARWAVAADLDGDDDLDVVVAAYLDGEVIWFENMGAGNFNSTANKITVSARGPWMVHTADIDGDGDLDVLTASRLDDTIAWYANNGAGSFSEGVAISIGANGAMDVFAADLDGDDDLDVLSASQTDGRIVWYENLDAAGTFGPGTDIAVLYRPNAVIAADLDGDDDMDVVAPSSGDGRILWFENLDGSGTFSGGKEIVDDLLPLHVIAADIDGDGDLDLVAASDGYDQVDWYENGHINITSSGTLPPSATPSPAAVALPPAASPESPTSSTSTASSASSASADATGEDGCGINYVLLYVLFIPYH